MKFKVVRENAKLPTKAYPDDAGFDLYANLPEPLILEENQRTTIPTGVAVDLPKAHFALILPRSGLSKDGVVVIVGTVDNGYTGELIVNVVNLSGNPITLGPGMKIAQLVPLRMAAAEHLLGAEIVENIEPRGERGFGSSGA
jgi:dUTP pyrophosphatase